LGGDSGEIDTALLSGERAGRVVDVRECTAAGTIGGDGGALCPGRDKGLSSSFLKKRTKKLLRI
jgi:hypothetical protein